MNKYSSKKIRQLLPFFVSFIIVLSLAVILTAPVLAQKIENPVNVNSLDEYSGKLIGALLKIIVPFLILFLVLTGTYFVMARGNREQLQVAKRMLVGTAIGTSIILGAWLITEMVTETIELITNQ